LIAVGTIDTKYEQMEGQAAAVEMGGEASGLQQQQVGCSLNFPINY
jgi:hypothetical protein